MKNNKIKKKIKNNKKIKEKKYKKVKKKYKYFIEYIRLNYLYFSILFIATLIFSYIQNGEKGSKLTYKIFMGFLSLIISIIFSYKIHYYSHYSIFKNFSLAFYESFECCKKIKIPNSIKLIFYSFYNIFFNFHTNYHHDSIINKKWYFIFFEGLQNLFNCGGFLILLFYFYDVKISIKKVNYYFNYNIIILWALSYASYHLINYSLKERNNCHENHHKNPFKNFGPDFMDILYETKYDIKNFDNINDGALNIILITIFLLLIRQFTQYIF